MAKSTQQLYLGDFTVTPPVAVQIDLDADISIPYEFKVADVRDIIKRGSGFSYDFLLPGTPTNNQFFAGISDINITYDVFNPNVRTQARFLLDGEELVNGYLHYKKTLRDHDGNIQHSVTLYDLTGDFFQTVRPLFVNELDLSALDHVLNLDNVKNSWDNDWNLDHLGAAGGGYYYPLLFDDNEIQPRPIEHFQPGIFYKRVLDEIVKQAHPDYPSAEYTWSGTLKDDTDFEREGFPYTGDKPKISEAEADLKTCFVGRTADRQIITSGNSLGDLLLTNVDFLFNDETTAPFDDSNNLWDGVKVFTAPSAGLYKFDVNIGLDVEHDYTVDDSVSGFNSSNREIRHTGQVIVDVQDGSGNTVNPYYFEIFGVHEPYELPFEPGNNPLSVPQTTPGQFASKLTNMSTGSYTESLTVNLPNVTSIVPGVEEGGAIWMDAGWTVHINLRMKAEPYKIEGTNDIDQNGVEVDTTRYYIKAGSHFRSQKFQHSYASGQTIDMATLVDPNFKQVDVLQDLVARKNVVIYVNPENENDIVFDYRDDFFNNGPTMDLTQQAENAIQDEIIPIGDLQNQEIILSYTKGDDVYHKAFQQQSAGDIYGQQKILFGNEFTKGVKNIVSPFMATPFSRIPLVIPASGGNPLHVSTAIVPSIKVNEPKTKPRVLYFRKGLLTDDVSVDQDGTVVKFQIEYKDGSGNIAVDEITGYPYAGHYDHPINPTYDINQGVLPFVLADMPAISSLDWVPTSNTEYNRRWQNTIKQLVDGRMRKIKCELRPHQVHSIRSAPNTNIFIENTYYYINKVLFEGNQNLSKLAVLELITVEDSLNLPIDAEGYGGTFQDAKDPSLGNNQNDTPGVRPSVNSGNTVGADSEDLGVVGSGNVVGSKTKNVTIKGDKNFVNSGAKNVIITNGDRNYVEANNVTIRNSSNWHVTTDGVTIDNNTVFFNGKSSMPANLIDGGANALRASRAMSDVNLIDGGLDEVVNPFSTSTIDVIDSETGQGKKI